MQASDRVLGFQFLNQRTNQTRDFQDAVGLNKSENLEVDILFSVLISLPRLVFS